MATNGNILTKPSGVPAITMKANGEEYILWKLKK